MVEDKTSFWAELSLSGCKKLSFNSITSYVNKGFQHTKINFDQLRNAYKTNLTLFLAVYTLLLPYKWSISESNSLSLRCEASLAIVNVENPTFLLSVTINTITFTITIAISKKWTFGHPCKTYSLGENFTLLF